MREQFNLKNFLAGKYERFEASNRMKVTQLTYFPDGNPYVLAGVLKEDLLTWNIDGYYYNNDEESNLDLFGILKQQS